MQPLHVSGHCIRVCGPIGRTPNSTYKLNAVWDGSGIASSGEPMR